MRTSWLLVPLSIATALPMYAQFEKSLTPKTSAEYQQYVKAVEVELQNRWQGRSSSPRGLDERPEDKARVREGEFVVRELGAGRSTMLNDGLVHDWVGAMFLPGAKVARVIEALGDWNHQKSLYPEVIDSKLVSRNGNSAVGHWRLKRTKFVTVVFDVDLVSQVAAYDTGLSSVTTHTTRISEVIDAGELREKVLPPGSGHGYLWAFDAFWTLRQEPDGVFAECRTISLSRTIPPALAWMVGPLVESMPKESLLSTLRGTRQAIYER